MAFVNFTFVSVEYLKLLKLESKRVIGFLHVLFQQWILQNIIYCIVIPTLDSLMIQNNEVPHNVLQYNLI